MSDFGFRFEIGDWVASSRMKRSDSFYVIVERSLLQSSVGIYRAYAIRQIGPTGEIGHPAFKVDESEIVKADPSKLVSVDIHPDRVGVELTGQGHLDSERLEQIKAGEEGG